MERFKLHRDEPKRPSYKIDAKDFEIHKESVKHGEIVLYDGRWPVIDVDPFFGPWSGDKKEIVEFVKKEIAIIRYYNRQLDNVDNDIMDSLPYIIEGPRPHLKELGIDLQKRYKES